MGKHHVIIEGHHCLLHLAFYGLVISSVARRLLSLTGMAAWLGTSHEIGGEPAGGSWQAKQPSIMASFWYFFPNSIKNKLQF